MYRTRLRQKQAMETQSYTNDLHEALIRKCWHSKFEQWTQVDGCVDPQMVVDKFAQHFEQEAQLMLTNLRDALSG